MCYHYDNIININYMDRRKQWEKAMGVKPESSEKASEKRSVSRRREIPLPTEADEKAAKDIRERGLRKVEIFDNIHTAVSDAFSKSFEEGDTKRAKELQGLNREIRGLKKEVYGEQDKGYIKLESLRKIANELIPKVEKSGIDIDPKIVEELSSIIQVEEKQEKRFRVAS